MASSVSQGNNPSQLMQDGIFIIDHLPPTEQKNLSRFLLQRLDKNDNEMREYDSMLDENVKLSALAVKSTGRVLEKLTIINEQQEKTLETANEFEKRNESTAKLLHENQERLEIEIKEYLEGSKDIDPKPKTETEHTEVQSESSNNNPPSPEAIRTRVILSPPVEQNNTVETPEQAEQREKTAVLNLTNNQKTALNIALAVVSFFLVAVISFQRKKIFELERFIVSNGLIRP